jgi:hypothetical protein
MTMAGDAELREFEPPLNRASAVDPVRSRFDSCRGDCEERTLEFLRLLNVSLRVEKRGNLETPR